MKKYWNITLVFIMSSFVVLCFLHLSTTIQLRSPNLMEYKNLEDLKLIYELNKSLESLCESGSVIESPKLRLGGGYEISVIFINRSRSYYLQGDRIICSEYVNGEEIQKFFVEVNREELKVISRRVRYIWNQLDKSHG